MKAAVVTFEEHGEVLPFWHRERLKDAAIVVADGHLDVKRISHLRLGKLDGAAADAAALAALRRDPPLRDDDTIAYGSDDFLYAAGHLGLVERVVWVAPMSKNATPRQLGNLLWESLSFVPGYGQEVLTTFTVDEASARARIGPLVVEATTAALLPAVGISGAVRVDVDLDYFCRPYERLDNGGVVALVRALQGLLDPTVDISATYSTAAGHMPRRMRWLSGALASALQRPVVDGGASPIVADYRFGRGAEFAERSLLALRAGDVHAAEHLCDAAVDAGDHATCPAYELALHHLRRRDYKGASRWLSRTLWTLADSVQGHALVLDALCAARYGDHARALDLALQCVDVLPLREEGYVLAASCERALGQPEAATRHQQRWDEVVAVRARRR